MTHPAHAWGVICKKFATVVEGDPKTPFSKATWPRCREGLYSIPWIAPLYLSKAASSTILGIFGEYIYIYIYKVERRNYTAHVNGLYSYFLQELDPRIQI